MKLKSFLANIKLYHQKERLEPEVFDFPDSIQSPKQILVCLPEGLRELTLVKQFLPTLATLFKSSDFSLISMPGVRVADIYPRKGFNIISPSSDQVTWSGVAKKSFLANLSQYNFDMVIDLNFENSAFTSSILLNFPKAIRVGKGNHRGDPFYNLEIKTRYLRDERNIYRSLLDTLALLKTGRSSETRAQAGI
jgi:hypothetical protein